MTTYESEIKKLNTSSEKVFELFSNLSNLEKALKIAKEQEGKDIDKHLKDITFDNDSIRAKSHGVGEIGLRIIEREPNKTIKFETENAPVQANLWIQFVEKSETDTRMKLTIKADIPKMIKMMVGGKIQDGINKIADAIELAVNKKAEKDALNF